MNNMNYRNICEKAGIEESNGAMMIIEAVNLIASLVNAAAGVLGRRKSSVAAEG